MNATARLSLEDEMSASTNAGTQLHSTSTSSSFVSAAWRSNRAMISTKRRKTTLLYLRRKFIAQNQQAAPQR